MSKVSNKIGLTFAASVLGYVEYLQNALGVQVLIMGITIILDYVTGIGKAAKNGNLWSRRAWTGGLHKLWYVIAMILGVTADYMLVWLGSGAVQGIVFEWPPIIGATVAIWITATESISILENLDELTGGKMPKFLKNLFLLMQEKSESAGGGSIE